MMGIREFLSIYQFRYRKIKGNNIGDACAAKNIRSCKSPIFFQDMMSHFCLFLSFNLMNQILCQSRRITTKLLRNSIEIYAIAPITE